MHTLSPLSVSFAAAVWSLSVIAVADFKPPLAAVGYDPSVAEEILSRVMLGRDPWILRVSGVRQIIEPPCLFPSSEGVP